MSRPTTTSWQGALKVLSELLAIRDPDAGVAQRVERRAVGAGVCACMKPKTFASQPCSVSWSTDHPRFLLPKQPATFN